jgi:hypothetical protein
MRSEIDRLVFASNVVRSYQWRGGYTYFHKGRVVRVSAERKSWRVRAAMARLLAARLSQ